MSSTSTSAASAKSNAIGNVLWNKQPKANAELFALTYGALMGELLRDLEKPDLICAELDRMGHSMGIRSVEEFLAKAGGASDIPLPAIGGTFAETPQVLKMALRMFFGIAADSRWKDAAGTGGTGGATTAASVAGPGGDGTAAGVSGGGDSSKTTYALLFTENPLTLFVELPEELSDTLEYNQLLAGWCRGVLELLQFDCTCKISQSVLAGDGVNEITVTLNQVLQEGAGEDYQEE